MMTISKSRGSTKKLGPISVGSKIVRFKIPSFDRRFTVHEDLICRTSVLFKRELQKNRKLIEHTGDGEDCCVCQEALDATTKDITYCVTCGQNVHDSCIEQWKITSSKPGADRPLPTCPMCRAAWKNEPMLKNLRLNDKVDAEAVQRYLDWLYSGTLHIPATASRRTDTFNLALLKCWAVASAVDDKSFKKVVIGTFFDEATAQFWTDSVKWAFLDGSANEEIKTFIIEVFMAHMDKEWFKVNAEKWPKEFVWELADRALDVTKRKSYERIQREWMKTLQIEDDEVDVQDDKIMFKPVSTAPYRTDKANKFFGNSAKTSIPFSAKDSVPTVTATEPSDWQILMRVNALNSKVENLIRR